jgi:hypothetical protein
MNEIQKRDALIQVQDFQAKLNKEPDQMELDRTPDGRAKTLPISFVEMTLDELFLGQWGTRSFTSKLIANEVVGEIELWVIHPITGREITRTGAASIIIQVDKAPDTLEGKLRNEWALDPSNKKPNALDLGYPKLKAECLKNAAASIGKIFGRDINRKKSDVYQPTLKVLSDAGFKALIERVEKGDFVALAKAETNFILTDLQREMLNNAPKQLTNG